MLTTCFLVSRVSFFGFDFRGLDRLLLLAKFLGKLSFQACFIILKYFYLTCITQETTKGKYHNLESQDIKQHTKQPTMNRDNEMNISPSYSGKYL